MLQISVRKPFLNPGVEELISKIHTNAIIMKYALNHVAFEIQNHDFCPDFCLDLHISADSLTISIDKLCFIS